MDKFGSVGAFVRAAETRNFSEAGRQLGISSSAIGKAISRLEQRLAVRLFHRSTRSVTLTPEGELFLNRCQRILEEIDAAESELAAGGLPRGELRVGLPMVGTLLMPALGAFIRAYPDIRLELDFSDRLVDVIEEGFDVVLRTGDAIDSRLVTRSLGHYEPVIVAAPAYLERRGLPISPEDLQQHACLLHRFPSTGRIDRWALRRAGEVLELELQPLAVASAVEPLIEMVEQGLGLAYVPDFLVRQQLQKGVLTAVLQEFAADSKIFRALWPSGRHLAPKIRVFVEFMGRNVFPDGISVPSAQSHAGRDVSSVLQAVRAPRPRK